MTDDESVKDLLCSFKEEENTPEGRQEIAKAIAMMCITAEGCTLMTDDESVKDLYSFKDKENTPEGRQEIVKAIYRICQTTAGNALMTDDESVKDLLAPLKIKRIRQKRVTQ